MRTPYHFDLDRFFVSEISGWKKMTRTKQRKVWIHNLTTRLNELKSEMNSVWKILNAMARAADSSIDNRRCLPNQGPLIFGRRAESANHRRHVTEKYFGRFPLMFVSSFKAKTKQWNVQ